MYLALASMEKVSWGSGSACAARVLGLQPFVRHCSVAKEATLLDKCYITAVLAAQIESTCCLTPVVVWLRFFVGTLFCGKRTANGRVEVAAKIMHRHLFNFSNFYGNFQRPCFCRPVIFRRNHLQRLR